MIAPMLARATTGAGNRTPVDLATLVPRYTFDVKLDGLRAIVYVDGDDVRIINRSGNRITAQFPEVIADRPRIVSGSAVIDGEIVADTGRFETVATRGKTVKAADVARRAQAMPCRFVAFDLLQVGGLDLMAHPYIARRAALEDLAADWADTRWRTSIVSDDGPAMWANVAKLGMEGLIAKRKDSPYIPGGRTDAWLKFKVTRRLTCVAIGYEPGEGSRAHFGAMHLALLGPSGPVIVGRVGTGFKAADIRDCKARLDAGQPFAVEVEALNRTKDNQLRFPVYKGIRTDLPVTAATLDQLATLPLC